MHLAKAHHGLHLHVLRLAVAVLRGAEGVGDALEGVHEGAGTVVGWVNLRI